MLLGMSACVLVLSALLAGTAYAQTLATTHDAKYDWEGNVLVLNFTEGINRFMVDMSEITIADEPCAITLTHDEYGAVSRGSLSFTIHLTEAHRSEISKMREPVVRVHPGAFTTLEGMELAPSGISLSITGDVPEDAAPCLITYGFNEPLLRVHARNYTQTQQAIHAGFDAWAELNPGLAFAEVEDDPLIWISWEEYQPGHVGLACLDCLSHGASMDIILYSYNCRSERIYYMPNNIRNTIAHEFGHILGLEHHVNQTHLMYGSDYVVDPFPTLGYTIPEELPEGFRGEQEMIDRYLELGGILNETEAALIELDRDIERYADRYAVERSDNAIFFETGGQVGRYNGMIKEYNALVDKYNTILDDYNEQVDELNCMYESVPPESTPAVTPPTQ